MKMHPRRHWKATERVGIRPTCFPLYLSLPPSTTCSTGSSPGRNGGTKENMPIAAIRFLRRSSLIVPLPAISSSPFFTILHPARPPPAKSRMERSGKHTHTRGGPLMHSFGIPVYRESGLGGCAMGFFQFFALTLACCTATASAFVPLPLAPAAGSSTSASCIRHQLASSPATDCACILHGHAAAPTSAGGKRHSLTWTSCSKGDIPQPPPIDPSKLMPPGFFPMGGAAAAGGKGLDGGAVREGEGEGEGEGGGGAGFFEGYDESELAFLWVSIDPSFHRFRCCPKILLTTILPSSLILPLPPSPSLSFSLASMFSSSRTYTQPTSARGDSKRMRTMEQQREEAEEVFTISSLRSLPRWTRRRKRTGRREKSSFCLL